jgi:2-dehydro-3-deoxyphosphogluconate aldolase/(4S)-4-hydroxy-2-oxoglutarate aldolase
MSDRSLPAATAAALEAAGVVAVIRIKDPSRLADLIGALIEGGVTALEVTMTVPGAVDLIRRTARTLPPGFLLGAGTVTDPDTVAQVAEAGASFVVSPVFRESVVRAAHAQGIAALPCFTPTEIFTAWEAGADIVKVFPATTLGPRYLTDLRGPLPHLRLMPTGGVTVENAGEWIAAGAVAVGAGTALLDAAAIAAGDWPVIAGRARRIVANVREARGRVR